MLCMSIDISSNMDDNGICDVVRVGSSPNNDLGEMDFVGVLIRGNLPFLSLEDWGNPFGGQQ